MFKFKLYLQDIKYWFKKVFTKPKHNKIGEYKRLKYNGYCNIKIKTWLKRENISIYHQSQDKPSLDYLPNIKSIQNWVLRHIEYKVDKINYNKKDYWASTTEILRRGSGDCEDIAFVIYRKLIERGYPTNNVGIILVKSHAFACLYFNEFDFWVIDSGHLTKKIVKASELFPETKIRLLAGFNHSKQWSY